MCGKATYHDVTVSECNNQHTQTCEEKIISLQKLCNLRSPEHWDVGTGPMILQHTSINKFFYAVIILFMLVWTQTNSTTSTTAVPQIPA